MREETEGMQVITVGVSSGGFIAAILASSLKASYCLDFAGQFSLLYHWTHVDTNPFLKELYVLFEGVRRVIVIGSWFKFLFVCAGVGILGYVLVLILLFNKDERKKVLQMVLKRKSK